MFRPVLPEWDSSYPDPVRLRREVDAMVDSFVEALLGEMPNEDIQGIYLKGSAHKEWDSPIDYVPEISDVDIHIQFYSDEAWRSHIGTFAQAMKIHREVERAYLSKIKEPLHTPRPQLIVVNKMVRELEFVHSPRETVRVLYGEEYPLADYSDPDSIRRVECERLLADGAYLADYPLHIIDRFGRYIWESLRTLAWRVSPAGPRALHILGVDTAPAWSVNRTRIVAMLAELGEADLADRYLEFYIAGWRYFNSRYEDYDAGRAAISAGVEALGRALEIAAQWLAGRGLSDV